MRSSWPMWLGLLLGMAGLLVGLATNEVALEQWSAATRYTARIGFPFLIIAYSARPLVDITRATWARELLAKRKWIGLGFALSHTVHLAAIIILFNTQGKWPLPTVLVFGGLAYLMLYAMAFTSNRAAMNALGARWKTLHRFGIHYLWFLFAQSYFGRIFEDGKMEEGLIGFGIAMLAAGLRFTAWWRKRARNAVTA